MYPSLQRQGWLYLGGNKERVAGDRKYLGTGEGPAGSGGQFSYGDSIGREGLHKPRDACSNGSMRETVRPSLRKGGIFGKEK